MAKRNTDLGELFGTEVDKEYDALKAKQESSAKAKGVLRGAGYARGGGVGRAKHSDEAEDKALIKKELKNVKITPKKHGGKVDGKKPHMRADKYARGGSAPRGKHTKISINVGASQADKAMAAQQGAQMGAKLMAAKMAGAGPRPMAGAPMQARPPMPAPAPGGMPGAGPQGAPPTMGQKRGGRTYAKGGKVGPVRVKEKTAHLSGGGGGAIGRLEKRDQYGTKPKK